MSSTTSYCMVLLAFTRRLSNIILYTGLLFILFYITCMVFYTPQGDIQNLFYGYVKYKRISNDVKKNSSISGGFLVERLTTNRRDREEQLDYFKQYWYFQHDMRINFEGNPCKKNMTWYQYNPQKTAYTVTSAKYSHVTMDIQPAGQYSRLIITSYSLLKTRKYFGGDSWRIHVHGETSVPVTVKDNTDGTYEVLFLIMEPGFYSVNLYLDYTLCEGYKDPPLGWFKYGNAQGKNQPLHVLPGHYQSKPFMEEKYPEELNFQVKYKKATQDLIQSVRYIQYPHKSCFMIDGFGRWLNDFHWKEYITEPRQNKSIIPSQKGKGKFWILGDSVGDFLHKAMMNTKLCTELFASCNRTYYWVYKLTDDNFKTDKYLEDDNDFSVNRVLSELQEVLNQLDDNSALLLNYGLHYAMGISFQSYQGMIEEVINLIQKHHKNGFKGKVIWKTTTALFKWRYGHQNTSARHHHSRRFLTPPRVELFNAYATSKMCEAGVDVIDIYPMSFSYPKGTRLKWDAVHYSPIVFKSVQDYLYNYFQ